MYRKFEDSQFEDVYTSHYSRMKRFARQYVIQEEDAENIVHDVFMDLWENRHKLSTITNLSGYLFISLKNKCIDFIRHKQFVLDVADKIQAEHTRMLNIKLQSLEIFDDKIFSENKIEEIVQNAINALPERCRKIFVMNKLEGIKQKEIAKELNISVNTVENQISIAYRKLKASLKDHYPIFIFFFF